MRIYIHTLRILIYVCICLWFLIYRGSLFISSGRSPPSALPQGERGDQAGGLTEMGRAPPSGPARPLPCALIYQEAAIFRL